MWADLLNNNSSYKYGSVTLAGRITVKNCYVRRSLRKCDICGPFMEMWNCESDIIDKICFRSDRI